MRAPYFAGWFLLLLAFGAAASEAIPRAIPGDEGFIVSAFDLWYAASPGSLVVAQIRVERLAPALWDPVLITLLQLPAWLLAGVPGGLLVWFCRPRRELTEAERDDLERHEESLFLFDELAREAKAAGYAPDEDDHAPDHGERGLIDDLGSVHPYDETDLFPRRVPDDPADGDGGGNVGAGKGGDGGNGGADGKGGG